jgi:hypothetical protein
MLGLASANFSSDWDLWKSAGTSHISISQTLQSLWSLSIYSVYLRQTLPVAVSLYLGNCENTTKKSCFYISSFVLPWVSTCYCGNESTVGEHTALEMPLSLVSVIHVTIHTNANTPTHSWAKSMVARRLLVTASVVLSSPILVTLMKEVLRSSETLVLTRATRPNIPEDAILHSHRPENLKSYNVVTCLLRWTGLESSYAAIHNSYLYWQVISIIFISLRNNLVLKNWNACFIL